MLPKWKHFVLEPTRVLDKHRHQEYNENSHGLYKFRRGRARSISVSRILGGLVKNPEKK